MNEPTSIGDFQLATDVLGYVNPGSGICSFSFPIAAITKP